MPKLYTLLPRLASKVGHIYTYHRALQRALEQKGWVYCALFPRGSDISPTPPHWSPTLASDLSASPKSLWEKGVIFVQNIAPFRSLFKQIEGDADSILFLEHFELPHLASIAAALLFLKPRFSFWILHRYPASPKGLKTLFYRLFHRFLERKMAVRYLTDSDLLAECNQAHLHRPFAVAPIPHTTLRPAPPPKSPLPLLLWWPGGLIREEKGLATLRSLLPQFEQRGDTLLIASEKLKNSLSSPKILFLPSELSDEEFIAWMQKAHLILLPYLSSDYKERTSGIFVEAICLGALPIVTKGTWMEYELLKFGISELSFTWEEPDLLEQLHRLPGHPTLPQKLSVMQSHYQTFHSESGIATFFESLAKESLCTQP